MVYSPALRYRRNAIIVAFIATILVSADVHASDKTIRIAAASSMRFVLDDLINAYREIDNQSTVQTIYGSSGNLYRQILQGAPYDLFLSADEQYIDDLQSKNRMDQSVVFALGTLVLQQTTANASADLLQVLVTAVGDGELDGNDFKIAIGNPAHAPFGKAAQQALQGLGIWEAAKSRLIIADNVSQAAQFARSGAVAFAFVAQSLAGQLAGQSQVVPQQYYSPVTLKLGVLNGSSTANRFLAFTQSEGARSYFKAHDLRLPVSDDG